MAGFSQNFPLTAASIDEVSALIENTCKQFSVSRKDALRLRLSIEEALLNWLNHFGPDHEIQLRYGRRFFRPYISLICFSDQPLNPFSSKFDSDPFSRSVLQLISNSVDFYYSNGRNCLTFYPKKEQINPLLKLGIIIAASILLGFLGRALLPGAFLVSVTTNLITPTYSKFLDVLGCIAGPLIFFSVAWGIYGIGDVATLSHLGKGLMLHFLRNVFLAAFFAIPAFPLFHVVFQDVGVNTSQLLQIYQLFLNMLPSTVIEPFSTGNTLQLIVLAVVVGVAMLYLGRRSNAIALAVEQINYLVSFIMEFISRLVPYFVIIVLVNLIWSGSLDTLKNSWRFVFVLAGALLLNCTVFLLVTSISRHVSPWTLLKKTFPPALIALSTASSAASFGELVTTCKDRLGVKDSLTSFGVPLGIVMLKPASAINSMLIILYISGQTGVNCSVSWLIMGVLVCTVIAMATPPVPGGATIAYTMLFTQMGLPLEYLGVVLAIEMLTDFIITSSNIFCLPLTLTSLAARFDMLDTDILKEKPCKSSAKK